MDNAAPTSETQQSLPRNVKILGLASLLNDIASEMIFPLVPTFLLTVLGGNFLYLGAIEGLADSVASLLKLWSGGRSDQAGRRKGFLLVGYAVTVVVRPLIGIITAPWQLMLIRVSDRLGKGVRTAPRDALIADSTDAGMRGRAFGFHRAMDHLGAAIGPALAALFLWLWPGEYRVMFLLTIVPGILVMLALIFGLREAPATEAPKTPMRLTFAQFGGNFWLFLVALVVFTLGNSSDAFLLVRAEQLGVPVLWLPILWCAFHIVKFLGNLLLGPMVDRFSPRPFIFLGWFVYGGVYIAFGVASEAWHAWACFLVYALFYGLTEPAEKTLVTHLVGAQKKGLAFGWFNFAIGIATLPSSLIFGAIYQEWGPREAFGFGALMALVAALLLLGVSTKNSRG